MTTAKSARAARTAKATALKGTTRPQAVSNGTLVPSLLRADSNEVIEPTASQKAGGGSESTNHGPGGTGPDGEGETWPGEDDIVAIDDGSDGGVGRPPKRARTQETPQSVEPPKRSVQYHR